MDFQDLLEKKLEILDLLEKLALVVELVEVVVVELVFSSSTFSTKVLLPKIEADNFFPALSKSWMYWIKTSVSGLIAPINFVSRKTEKPSPPPYKEVVDNRFVGLIAINFGSICLVSFHNLIWIFFCGIRWFCVGILDASHLQEVEFFLIILLVQSFIDLVPSNFNYLKDISKWLYRLSCSPTLQFRLV